MKINIFLLLIFFSISSYGQVQVSANIDSDATWSGYIFVTKSISVAIDVTLTVQPGTIVKFEDGARLTVYGTLNAIGNAGSKIYFTTKNDNTIGMIIGSSSGTPAKGDWNGIYMYGPYDPQGIGNFDYCVIKYGGGGGNYPANVSNNSGYGSFKNSECSESGSYGYHHFPFQITIENNTFVNNEKAGIFYQANNNTYQSATINNNTFTTNYDYAMVIEGDYLPNISNNGGSGNSMNSISIEGALKENVEWGGTSALPFTMVDDIVVNSGYTLSVTSGILDCGVYPIRGTGSFTLGSGANIYLRTTYGINSGQFGSIQVSGSRNLSTSAGYYYLGTEQQNTGNGLPNSVGMFYVDNGSGIVMTSDLNVSGTIHMADGDINTNGNTLTLGEGTSSLGTLNRTSGNIIGTFKRWFANTSANDILFPLGTSTNDYHINISYTSAPSTGGTLTTSFNNLNPGINGLPLDDSGTQLTSCSTEGYWIIAAGDGLNGGSYSLDLTADGFNGISKVSSLRIVKRTSGGPWLLDGTHSVGTGTNTTPIIHRNGLSGFSEFGIASPNENVLPVELISFTAIQEENNVLLNWKTATELNNYGFEIERKTETGEWEMLGFKSGHGNSNSEKEYEYIDKNPIKGHLKYKLKQIDTDGSCTYYDLMAEVEYSQITDLNDLSETPKEYQLYPNYPNPFNPSTTINYQVPSSSKVKLTVFDALGREIKILINDQIKNQGIHQINWNASELTSGVYMLFMKAESLNGKANFQTVRKMILTK